MPRRNLLDTGKSKLPNTKSRLKVAPETDHTKLRVPVDKCAF